MIRSNSLPRDVTAEKILDLLMGLWKAGVVKAGIELDLFTQIAEGCRSAKEIAEAVQSDERRTQILLNALCGLGLLEKKGEGYELSPEAAAYLSKTSPWYIDDLSMAITAPWEWQAFAQLAVAVREGKPIVTRYMEGEEASCLEKMVLAIGTIGLASAARICDVLEIGILPRARFKVLDIGCGTGVYGFTVAQRESNAKITSVDRRTVIQLAKRIAEQMGVSHQISFRPGNIFSLNYGSEEYDLVLVSNVLHQYNADRAKLLLHKAYQAVKTLDGVVLIHDFIADDERCQDTASLLMSTDMLLYTDDGEVHTYSEYQSWLEEVGFKNVRGPTSIPNAFTSILTAQKL